MRLFIGIDLPDEVKEEVSKIIRGIGSKNAKIKYVAKKNLHLTLKFLLNVDPKYLSEIIKRLEVIDIDEFKLRLGKISFFKRNEEISSIYLVIEPQDKLTRLQQRIDESLLDIFPKDQKFSPHLTLGRIKLLKKRDEFIKNIEKIIVKKVEFKVKSFILFESKLTKDGPKYKTLRVFNK